MKPRTRSFITVALLSTMGASILPRSAQAQAPAAESKPVAPSAKPAVPPAPSTKPAATPAPSAKPAASPTTKPATAPAPTVVLVHGAFADGSSWNKIIPLLQAKGLSVIAIQNPLTSLADDVAATKRVLDAQTGPVVLVGHSWGGTVITQAGNHPLVAALVYVAAFAPSDGQSSMDTSKGFPTPPGIGKLAPYADGFVRLPSDAVATDFAQDVSKAEANLIAVTQGPIRGANFGEKVEHAAWQSRPCWYIVATKDRMIDPDQERAMAKKINATTRELATSHVPMASRPKDVADVILAAAHQVQSGH
jgi:pimeloyl-ACP methyl ester carboxylesterase